MTQSNGYSWVYAELAGVVFRYNTETGALQRIFAYAHGWEELSRDKDPDRYNNLVKEVERTQDLTQSDFYKLFGTTPSFLVETISWITVPSNLDSPEGSLVRAKVMDKQVYLAQLERISELPQPVTILGGSMFENERDLFVATLSGDVYLVRVDGRMSSWVGGSEV